MPLRGWGSRAATRLFWVYIATLMVPATVTVVPSVSDVAEAGLPNTFWALVLPFMFGSPYAIFLLREYFRTIPADLIQAARDGRRQHAGRHRARGAARQPPDPGDPRGSSPRVSQWNNFMWPLVITAAGGQWC